MDPFTAETLEGGFALWRVKVRSQIPERDLALFDHERVKMLLAIAFGAGAEFSMLDLKQRIVAAESPPDSEGPAAPA